MQDDSQGKENTEEQSFADILSEFEKSSAPPAKSKGKGRKKSAGPQHRGTVVGVSGDFILIDYGSKAEGVIPAAQHKPISKLARKTNHIERFNNTLRQRVSRLVREALSFSKKLANHIGAIKLFIW